jgi:hypothetical protein
MDDTDVLAEIQRLVDEEHDIERRHEGDALAEGDIERLRTVEERLDQCWDLLRQRRARRSAGMDPDTASARDIDTVEHYQQ